jgi:hypothetical protein
MQPLGTDPLEIELEPLADAKAPEEGKKVNVDRTRALLAYLLLALFSAVLLILLLLLGRNVLSVDQFSQVSSVALTPIVGLLGAATGYYYGRSSK